MSKGKDHSRPAVAAEHPSTAIASDCKASPAVALACVAIIICGLAAYSNSFTGQFTFDDSRLIWQNRHLLHPQSPGQTIWYIFGAQRPVTNLTFMLNYWAGGLDVWGYHAVNVGIHIVAALTLFGLLRRTFVLASSPRGRGLWLALIVAVLWVVHPLNTQAVTYIVQRSESLMGMFYLLTLYCFVRGSTQDKPGAWYLLAVIACALGMGTKQVMVTAPIAVAIYDRAFFCNTFKEMFAKRGRFYLALASTLLIVVCLVAAIPAGDSVGDGDLLPSPLQYLLSQFGVILQYLYLVVWPARLSMDYGWPVAGDAMKIVLPALAVAGLVALSIIGLRRGRRIGLAGVWFFLILIPTSSLLPIADLAVEHRMYLSLIGAIAVIVLGAYAVGQRAVRRGWAPAGAAVVAGLMLAGGLTVSLGMRTWHRNALYHDEVALWKDTIANRSEAFRPRAYLADRLIKTGHLNEGIAYYYQALAISPTNTKARTELGDALMKANRPAEAAEQFGMAADGDIRARVSMATALARAGQVEQAKEQLRKALAQEDNGWAHYNLAQMLSMEGQAGQALEHYRRAWKAMPQVIQFDCDFAAAAADAQQADDTLLHEALSAAIQAVSATGGSNAEHIYVLSMLYARLGQWDNAAKCADQALVRARSARQYSLASKIEAAIVKYKGHESPLGQPN